MSAALRQLLVQPLRRRLLLEYSIAPASPSELARRLGEPLNLVSYHTGVLRGHGVIELERTERRRGALTHIYRASVATMIGDDEWATLAPSLRRSLVLSTLTQALAEARQAARSGGFDRGHAHLSRSPLLLDAQARIDVAACLEQTVDEIAAIAARVQARGEPQHPFEAVLLAFAVPQEPRGAPRAAAD